MNTTIINQLGYSPILPLLNSIPNNIGVRHCTVHLFFYNNFWEKKMLPEILWLTIAAQTLSGFMKEVGILQSAGIPVLFSFTADLDAKNPSTVIAQVPMPLVSLCLSIYVGLAVYHVLPVRSGRVCSPGPGILSGQLH
jgi:hypothetical protein